ncbi:MAG: hypothetical protein KF852_19560 [Saprospiraceae bacterium]|nr:hypothetical protein [Saprospiraceae bacterium]
MKNDELENLKSAWNAAAGESPSLGQGELLSVMRARTQSVFSKMRRNLLFEMVFGIFAMAAWAYFVSRIAPGNGEAYLAGLQMILLTVLPLGFYYFSGFRHLGRGMASDSRLIPALRQTIAYWDQVLPLYFWGGAVMIPSFILSAVWLTNSIGGQYLLKLTDSMSWQKVVLWVIGLSAITILFVWISIKVSYAKHVNQLKETLHELEEAEG